jgi:hypothetical protein
MSYNNVSSYNADIVSGATGVVSFIRLQPLVCSSKCL